MTAQTANLIDITRHISVFSPDKFGKRRVDVIGADAVGSQVTLALAMLGIDVIHVWDAGNVDLNDVKTGAYSVADLGKSRVDVLKELVKCKTGCDILVAHKQNADGTQQFGDIVFLLDKSIDTRKTIWQKSIRNKIRTKLMIEPRFGAGEVRVNTIVPTKPAQTRAWEEGAKTADLSNWSGMSCASASVIAGLSVWQLMRWAAIEAGHTDVLEQEISIPLMFGSANTELEALAKKRIDIIGAGATGSHVIVALAMLGLTDIHVWDFDKIEAHNLANQAFMKADVGKFKVDAIKELVKQKTGRDVVTAHNERVDGTQELGDVVFLLTDTMASRKEIWQQGIRDKNRTQLMIETRMGVDEGRVYTVEPGLAGNVRRWEGSLYEDKVAEASACGASVSVGPTAMFLASFAMWQMLRWSAKQGGKADKLDNEIIFTFRPLVFVPAKFKPE
jgi:tRNA A37 threonylcarbamoyladenosine dehydratase